MRWSLGLIKRQIRGVITTLGPKNRIVAGSGRVAEMIVLDIDLVVGTSVVVALGHRSVPCTIGRRRSVRNDSTAAKGLRVIGAGNSMT